MFTAIEAREFFRYTNIQTQELLRGLGPKAKEFTKTVFSTNVGGRLLIGGMTTFLGLSSDQQANWQQDIALHSHQDAFSLDLSSSQPDSYPQMFGAPKYDPNIQVELPNVQVPVGEYETISRNGVELTRTYGAKEPDRRLTHQILLGNFSSYQEGKEMAKRIIEYFFIPDPLPNYLDKFTFWVRNPAGMEDLKCDNNGFCDDQAVQREIDRTTNATGILPQETIVLIKNPNNNGGWAVIDTDFSKSPSKYSYTAIVMPLIPTEIQKLTVGHYWGHSLSLVDEYLIDGGHGYIGDGFYNCTRNPPLWAWNPTPHKGCAWDKEAFRNAPTSIMKELVPYFGEITNRWIDQILQDPVYRYRLPEPDVIIRVSGLNISADLIAPLGTTQKRRLITPYNNDGPGITLIRNRENSFNIPAPQIGVGNYILLPDMTYTWEERDTNAKVSIPWESPQWNEYIPWPLNRAPKPPVARTFHTEKRFSDGIVPVYPKMNELVAVRRVKLQWDNRDKDVFYYEIQASKDCTFNTDPQTAIASVWHNLVHGGVTQPLNSWQTPDLESDTEYCWRGRPRVQGDGTPVGWSQTYKFKTAPQLVQGGLSSESDSITITLVQEVEGPGEKKEIVSYPHIIPLDEGVLPRREELTPAA